MSNKETTTTLSKTVKIEWGNFLALLVNLCEGKVIPIKNGVPVWDSTDFNSIFNLWYNNNDFKSLGVDKNSLLKITKLHFEKKPEESEVHVYDLSLPEWLQASQSKNNEDRFKKYQAALRKKGMESVVSQLDYDLTQILDKCHSPLVQGLWDRRGLVYGHVQSGKTANYVGLINRAFDHGYKIIIVLTGMTEDLRVQTQKRIDTDVDFVSPDKISSGTDMGGGEGMAGDLGRRTFQSLTNNISHKEKSIWVIKKNKVVLELLIMWFYEKVREQTGKKDWKGEALKNCPVLIIDDEADNASVQSLSKKEIDAWEIGMRVQAKNEDDRSKEEEELYKNAQEGVIKAINRNIRTLLSIIEQKTFVGYTATPYNIVVQELEDIKDRPNKIKHPVSKQMIEFKITAGDIFPEHFIYPLKPGKTYLGIERLFNKDDDKNIPAVINLDDKYNEDYGALYPTNRGHKYDFEEIPESLSDYLYRYIVAIIIKNHRGILEHNTMLVHTSHLTEDVDYMADSIADFHGRLIDFANSAPADFKKTEDELNDILEEFKENSTNPLYCDYFDFPQSPHGKEVFPNSITQKDFRKIVVGDEQSELKVISYHSSRATTLRHKFHDLDYGIKKGESGEEKYTNYIVVGGNKLSRGLTLEGLVVSYFIRSSTRQDSLYQMGRWFGYRSGYEDLVRICMPNDHIVWYNSVFDLEMMLREDLESNNDSDYPVLPRNMLIKLANKINIDSLISDKFPSICDPAKLRKTREATATHEGLTIYNIVLSDKKTAEENLDSVYGLFDNLYKDQKDKLFDYGSLDKKWEDNAFGDASRVRKENISFTDIPSDYVKTFFDNYEFHGLNQDNVNSFLKFIDETSDLVEGWSISLVNKKGGAKNMYEPYSLKKFNSKFDNLGFVTRNTYTDVDKGYKIGSTDEGRGINNIFDILDKNNVADFKVYKNDVFARFRNESKRPLMVIYPAQTKNIQHPLVYIHYPRLAGISREIYIMNKNKYEKDKKRTKE